MRAYTPEISWHNRLPALSLDISRPVDDAGHTYRIATGGNDCRVYIWLIDLKAVNAAANSNNKSPPHPDIRIRAGLRRHQKSVGSVRFSPQHLLASGDDDGYIYIWKHKIDENQQQHQDIPVHLQPIQPQVETNVFLNDDGFEDLELWQQQRVLRGHIEDICDLAWSKDGQYLLSGSVDNSAILWDATKGTKIWCSDLIKGYVQGVAIDPHAQFMAAISSDRTLRVYNFADKKLVNATRRMNIKGNFKAFFCDDTVQTFCRRLEFSPDGQFLVAPTSRMVEKERRPQAPPPPPPPPPQPSPPQLEVTPTKTNSTGDQIVEVEMKDEEVENKSINVIETIPDESVVLSPESTNNDGQEVVIMDTTPTKLKKPSKPFNVFLVFRRTSFNKPIHYYPTGREVALCARFSPVVYKLRDSPTNFWDIPYRIVFAVATTRSILIYDSQQSTPIGYASQIHLARLTDLAWSNDGRLLMISSYDGYSTLLTFDQDEFGEIYDGPLLEPVSKTAPDESKLEDVIVIGDDGEEIVKPSKKGQKRSKGPKETVAAKKEKLNLNREEKQEKLVNADADDVKEQEKSTGKTPKKGTPKKIMPTRVAETSTIWRYIVKSKNGNGEEAK